MAQHVRAGATRRTGTGPSSSRSPSWCSWSPRSSPSRATSTRSCLSWSRSRSGPRSWLARPSSSERSCSTWPGTLSPASARHCRGPRCGCPGWLPWPAVPCTSRAPQVRQPTEDIDDVGRHGPRPRMRNRCSSAAAWPGALWLLYAIVDRGYPKAASPEPGLVRSPQRRDRRSADASRRDARTRARTRTRRPSGGRSASASTRWTTTLEQARSEAGSLARVSTSRGANTTPSTRR